MVDKRKFKDTEVSLLGLGTMRLPCKTPIKRESNPLINYEKSQKLVDIAYENGVNYFDTAYMYHVGKSEKFIGTALKKYPRESYFLADKLPIWMCPKKSDMEKVFSNQLKRTGHDYFDFYLLHSLNKENFEKCEKFGAYEFVEKKREEGKVKNIGFSFHGTIEDLKVIVASHHWDFAQIQLNYLDWKNQQAQEQYNILTEAGIPVIIMEPVRGGKLADVSKDIEKMFKEAEPNKSVASWAIGFAATHSNVLTVLSGMNSEEQLYDNLNTLTDFKPFDDKKMQICFTAAGIMNKSDVIPCTGCDYCSDCPKEVKISSLFALYNNAKTYEIDLKEAKEKYSKIKNNASQCIECGKCASHCPQGIEIPKLLKNEISEFIG